MVKRSLSVLLTVLMTLSLIMVPAMGVSANVEKVDITDYVPNLDDDLITKAPEGSENKAGITSKNLSGTIYTFTSVNDAAATTENSDILQPMKGIQFTKQVHENLQANVPYVLKFVAKKGATSTADANLAYGIIDGGKGGKDYGWSWTNQWIYTEKITSTEGQEISQLFTITYPITTNTQLKIGMTTGNSNDAYAGKDEYAYIPGSVMTVDYSTVYLAPERAYDVENTISMTKVMPGAVVSGSAKVVNQIGTKGNLNQDITYFVTDTEGNVVEGVSVVAGTNGSYTATVDANAADGDYVITARAAAYNTTENFMQQSVTLTVEDVDYSDAYVEPVTANLGAMTKLTEKSGANYDYGTTLTESGDYYIFTNKESQTTVPNAIARPAGGVQWALADGAKGETYLMTFKVKKNGDSAVNPNVVFGFGDGSMGGSAGGWAWKAQTYYVQDITSTEWQTVVQEITLPCNTTASSVVTLGLGAGCTHDEWKKRTGFDFRPNVSAIVDMSSFAVYKSGGSKVSNTALTSTEVFAGGTIEAKAEVVNAAGIKGTLDQTMEYIVLDSATRKRMTQDITITTGADGNYTINVGEDAPAGEYVAVASNVTNGTTLRTGLEFTVETIDKFLVEHEAVMPDGYAFGNVGNGTSYGVTVTQDASSNWKFRATAAASRTDAQIPTSFARPAAGLLWPVNQTIVQKDIPYVISFNVKNPGLSDVVPNLVFGVVDDGQGGKPAGYNWLGQYTWSEDITSNEWTTISKTVTFAYDGTANTKIIAGLGVGNTYSQYNGKEGFEFRPNAVLDIDHNTMYFAPEAFYDVTVSASSEVVRAGGSITVDASAVNQINEEGSLEQNFSWVALNGAKNDVAEGISITTGDNSSEIEVNFDSDVEEGTYVIAAYSEDYSAARHIAITVSNTTSVENVAVDTANKTVTFDAVNVATDGMNGAVYVAEYVPGTDTFVKAEKVPFTLTAGNTKGKVVGYTLEIAEGNELRVYIWDNNLTPYIQPVSKKNN